MNRRLPARALALLAVTALAGPGLAACGTGDYGHRDTGGAVTLTDGSGTTLDVPAHTDRIVCLTAICDDALTELGLRPVASTGAGPRGILADPHFLGAEATSVPAVDGSFGEENVEQIVGADPQLVVGLEGAHDGLRGPVGAAAPLYLARIGSKDDSEAFLREMGRLTGRATEAEDAVARFETTLAEAARRAAPARARTLAMYGSDTGFGVDTRESVLGSVLGRLGDYPWPTPPARGGGHSAGQGTYSLEEIARRDPSVIFVQTFSFGPSASTPVSEQLAANPVWAGLRAVRAKRVVEVPTTLWAEGRGTRSLGLVASRAADVIARPTP